MKEIDLYRLTVWTMSMALCLAFWVLVVRTVMFPVLARLH